MRRLIRLACVGVVTSPRLDLIAERQADAMQRGGQRCIDAIFNQLRARRADELANGTISAEQYRHAARSLARHQGRQRDLAAHEGAR